jgi:hypothetical protein
VPYAEKTLQHVYQLWNHPVHLETVAEGKTVVLTCDEGKVSKKGALKQEPAGRMPSRFLLVLWFG